MRKLKQRIIICILRFGRLSLTILFLVANIQLFAQADNDKNDPYLAVSNIYHEIIGLNQLILNGRAYEHNYIQNEGDQFLVDKKLTSGTIIYDGIVYEGMMLNYDIYNDIVYFLWNSGGIPRYIILNEYRISSFTLHGMNFIRIKPNEVSGLEAGFYQLAFSGMGKQFLVKRNKEVAKQSLSATSDKWYFFSEKSSYFFVENGNAIPVKNKKSFLAQFGENPRLKGFIKKNSLRLGIKNPFFLNNAIEVLEFVEVQ